MNTSAKTLFILAFVVIFPYGGLLAEGIDSTGRNPVALESSSSLAQVGGEHRRRLDQDQKIDITLGAVEIGRLARLRTHIPVRFFGHVGLPPFNQDASTAQFFNCGEC